MEKDNLFSCNGFTLIELLIAMAITGIISAAIFTSFHSQHKSYLVQEDVAVMQQNLRAGMYIMVREIRMAGHDPENIGELGILNVCPRDIDNNIDITMTGNGAMQISADFDDNGVLGGNETISFSICDSPILTPDGNPDLVRNSGGGRQMLAENIEALGFAYAYDTDNDGNLDTSPNGHIIWAVDSDGDNNLDINLDTDDDGDIDAADGPGAGNNGIIGGTAIADVAVNDIRAVRIWMLAKAGRRNNKYLTTSTYVVGQKIITPNDKLRRRLLTTTVKCRNLGL